MSKTVKRVSKTVKRVMRVMMVGLVAMLGAKAEAHYYAFKGKAKYCSVCVESELAKHEEHPNNPATDIVTHTEHAEFCVTTTPADVSCPPGTQLNSPAQVKVPLVVRKQIVTTEDVTKVEGVIDTSGFCKGFSPLHALIRKMKVKIKTYACANSDCEPVSKLEGTCRLPRKYGFSDVGAPYNCSWQLPWTY